MAHQNLKFQVNPKNCDVWQPIYGGQHHGTFYMMYIKIHKHEVIEGDKLPHVYTCDFKLQNFRGAITMGLVEVKYNTVTESVPELEDHGPILHIIVSVKPFHKNDEILGARIAMKKPIEDKLLAVIQTELENPKKEIFNPDDLDNSLYINPHTHFRDGDEYNEVYQIPVGKEKTKENLKTMDGTGLGFCLADIIMFIFG